MQGFFVQEPIQEYKDLLNRVKNAIPVLKDLKDNEILYKDMQLDTFINFDPSEYSGNLHLSEAFRNGTSTGSDIHRLVHLQLRDTDLPFIFTKQDACSGVHTDLRMRRYVLWCNIHGSGGQESS